MAFQLLLTTHILYPSGPSLEAEMRVTCVVWCVPWVHAQCPPKQESAGEGRRTLSHTGLESSKGAVLPALQLWARLTFQ